VGFCFVEFDEGKRRKHTVLKFDGLRVMHMYTNMFLF